MFGTQDVEAASVMTANITSPLNLSIQNLDSGLLAVTFLATTNFTGTTLNCSYYSQTVGPGFSITEANWVVTGGATNDTANGTSTTITTDTALTVGNVSSVMISCLDEATFQVNSTHLFYEINDQPTISAISSNTSSDGTVDDGIWRPKGGIMSFTATWADANASGIDANQLFICATNAFSSGCTGTELCSSSDETDGSTTCDFTIPFTQPGGIKTAYAFLEDDNGFDIASSSSVVFGVIGGGTEEEDEDGTGGGNGGTDGADGDVSIGFSFSSQGIILTIIIAVGVIFVWRHFKKKK